MINAKVDEPIQRLKNYSSNSIMCKNNIVKAIKSEGLVIVASKNHGKTNTLQVLISEMKAIPIVIDYASQHCFKLGTKFQVKFLNESYWRKPKIRINKPIILDFSQTTKKQAGEILRDIIKREYYRRVQAVIEGFREGKTREQILERFKWLLFCIEESQDLIGRYLKQDDDLATAMNCGRNYKISFAYLSQRIADLNTSLVERCAYLIGKQIGDNNLRKISRILGIGRKKLKFIETLPKGEFVFYNGKRVERIQFPKFEGYGRAYEFRRELIQKRPRGLWSKLKEAFNPKPIEIDNNFEEDEEHDDMEKEFEREEEEFEEDEDLLLFQEEFSDEE